jgi:putative transcriptional regulator
MRNQVRATREAQGLTLRQLHQMTGISMGLLSGIENGKHVPNVKYAQRLAFALRTTVDVLFPEGSDAQSTTSDRPA